MVSSKESRINNLLLAAGICGVLVSVFAGILIVYNRMGQFVQNVIGKLYLQDKSLGKAVAYAMFEDIKSENIQASDEAFVELGLTDNAMYYMWKSMDMGVYIFITVLMIIFAVGIVVYALCRKKRAFDMEKRVLSAKISDLQQQQIHSEYVGESNKRMQNFIENVAHQIKTPISRVYSSLYLIEDDIKDDSGKERIEECYGHLESVNMLMRRLMDIGRLEAGKIIFKKGLIDFAELTEDAVKSCCGQERRVETVLQIDKTIEYYGDYEWLKEALMNIINNALEHNDSGSSVELVCKNSDDSIKITVRDYGSGLSEKDIPNIFDRFYMPEEIKSTHTGIGLNLAKLIVEGHFGSVYAYNHVDGGAVFNIILPLYSLKNGKMSNI